MHLPTKYDYLKIYTKKNTKIMWISLAILCSTDGLHMMSLTTIFDVKQWKKCMHVGLRAAHDSLYCVTANQDQLTTVMWILTKQ